MFLDQFSDISDWAPAWNRLSEEEKSSYKDKAKEEQRCPAKEDIPKLLKQMTHKVRRQYFCEFGLFTCNIFEVTANCF